MFCRLHHNPANEQSHWPESTNAIMQHKPRYCESGLSEERSELDVTICGFVILPFLYRTEAAFTVTFAERRRRYRERRSKDRIWINMQMNNKISTTEKSMAHY